MKKVLISFVGGRPLPNIQFILDEKPDALYLISSRDSAKAGGNKEKLINALPEKLKPVETFDVNPYIKEETMSYCKEIIRRNQKDEIILHLSSEPTTMSIGAFIFVSKKKKKRNLKLCYSSRDGVIDVFNSTKDPQKLIINIDDYFKVYGWTVSKKKEFNQDYNKVLSLIIGNVEVAHRLLSKIRSNNKGKGKRTLKITPLKEDELNLLYHFQSEGFVSNIQPHAKGASFIINPPSDEYIVTGNWLEYYVFKTARQINGSDKFDDCAWSIEDGKKGELDFAGVKNGQLIIASCKTEKNIKSEYLKELSARANQLGKGMCSKLFITSSPPPNDKTQAQKYERWEKDYQTKLVYGKDLVNLKDFLMEAIRDTRSRI